MHCPGEEENNVHRYDSLDTIEKEKLIGKEGNPNTFQGSPREGRSSISFPLCQNGSNSSPTLRRRFSDDTDISSKADWKDDPEESGFHVPVHNFDDLDEFCSLNALKRKKEAAMTFSGTLSHLRSPRLTHLAQTSPLSQRVSDDGEQIERQDGQPIQSTGCTKPLDAGLGGGFHHRLTGNWVRKLHSVSDIQDSPWKSAFPGAVDEDVCKESQSTGHNMKKFSQVVENCMPAGYELVAKYHLMEIKLLVFVHERHLSRVVKTERMSEGTGIGNVLGNKGGVAVKLTIDDTTFGFVCSHLAAHEGAKFLQQRNEDVVEIMRNVERNTTKLYGLPAMNQYTHLFWMGDLNYRLDLKRVIPAAVSWPHQERWCYIIDMIADRRFEELAGFDELVHEMALGNVFADFEEGAITFAPTFKVERGMAYPSYQSLRLPSYCDRILWRSLPLHKTHIKQTEYSSVPRIDSSDHKPVYAVFDMVIPLPVPIIPFPAPRDSVKCVIDFKRLVLHGLYEKRTEVEDGVFKYDVLSDGALALHENSATSKSMNTLRRMDTDTSPSHTTRRVYVDFHGSGLFVRDRAYRAEVPLKDGRERVCEYSQLPKIALRPIKRLGDLTFKYIVIVFTRFGSKQGSSCVLPISSLVQREGRHLGTKTLDLTKYGRSIAKVELEVELVVSMETWIDSNNKVVKLKR